VDVPSFASHYYTHFAPGERNQTLQQINGLQITNGPDASTCHHRQLRQRQNHGDTPPDVCQARKRIVGGILNEFTDAGIDALQVAESARGSYDVRLVAGGCLCCVGELEFGKQLRDILRNFKPARLLIEPSGAGHAADIVDTLAIYESQKALELDSIVCLVDAQDAARILAKRPPNEWSQIQSADALLLSKPDLAQTPERQAFEEIAAAQYPAKSYVGTCSHGELPEAAMRKFERAPRFSLVAKTDAISEPISSLFAIGGLSGMETEVQALGFWAVQWLLPRELVFARAVLEPRLSWLLEADQGFLRRMKGVFRTGLGPSWLVQSHGRGLDSEDSAFRRDSRIEIVLAAKPTVDMLDPWRNLLRDAANPRNLDDLTVR
jgi:G3E family GTPase